MADYLRNNIGCGVINPLALPLERNTLDYKNICAECIAVSDAVILMDGWDRDQECLDHFIIAYKLGVDVIFRCQVPMVIDNIKFQEELFREN